MNEINVETSIENNKHNKSIKPRIAWITVNRNCNMRCEWCYAKGSEYHGEMSLELAKRLAALINDCGIKKVILIGGEPTVWRHLLSFSKFCKKLGLKTQLATNALSFSDDTFWEKYKKGPNDLIGISLKGYDDLSYKKITEIDDFNSVMSGLRRSLNFFQCGIGTVYSSSNPKELVDTAIFSKNIGATYLNIGFCTPAITKKGSDGSFMLSPDQVVINVMSVYDEINSIMEGNISFSMKLPLCLWPQTFLDTLISRKQISTQCQLRQKTGLIFGVKGEVLTCNTLYDYPIGKFGEDFSTKKELLEFMNSSTIKGYYDKLNNYPSEKCISCEKYQMCGGGCPMFWSFYKADEVIKGFS